MSRALKVFIRMAILSALIICFRLLPRATSESKATQDPKNVEVVVTQLEEHNGFPPVVVKCTRARLNESNQLTGFSCTLKNNTTENITGVCLIYTIFVENKGGEIVKDTHSWVIESLIHPDFQETYKPITPGLETVMTAATISFGDATPKSVELNVDFVEFADGATLGSNLTGSKIIAEMKSGASLYKEWLAREHIKRGKSASDLAELIGNDAPALPDELKSLQANSNQEQGARAYKTLIRRLLDQKGPAEVMKRFP